MMLKKLEKVVAAASTAAQFGISFLLGLVLTLGEWPDFDQALHVVGVVVALIVGAVSGVKDAQHERHQSPYLFTVWVRGALWGTVFAALENSAISLGGGAKFVGMQVFWFAWSLVLAVIAIASFREVMNSPQRGIPPRSRAMDLRRPSCQVYVVLIATVAIVGSYRQGDKSLELKRHENGKTADVTYRETRWFGLATERTETLPNVDRWYIHSDQVLFVADAGELTIEEAASTRLSLRSQLTNVASEVQQLESAELTLQVTTGPPLWKPALLAAMILVIGLTLDPMLNSPYFGLISITTGD